MLSARNAAKPPRVTADLRSLWESIKIDSSSILEMTPDLQQNQFKRVGILLSGRGSNMAALADAITDGKVPGAEIDLVISDQPHAQGLELAAARDLDTKVIERRDLTRAEHDEKMLAAFFAHHIDLVCLAGYMRLLSPPFIAAYAGRILNIHPSLLPAFPGLHPHRQALDHGVKYSGCTVHFVDDTLDGGPIIAQAVVPVLSGDDEATLAARILEQEHQLYCKALALVVSGNYEVVGRRVLRKNQRPGQQPAT